VPLAISEHYSEPVFTIGVVSDSEHNTTSRLLTNADFLSSSNTMMSLALNCSKAISTIPTAQTSTIDPEVAEKLEAYVQMLVRGGYPEEQARVHALNHIASFE